MGCHRGELLPRTTQDQTLFGPAVMRIHPIFTSIKDWNSDGKPDGIEALIEFQDRFADPTKASGKVVFELFDYRTNMPDPRGGRVSEPWVGRIITLDEQQARWNRTSRTYAFQLAYADINPERTYVLTATFELSGGGRFFDQTILQGKKTVREKSEPASVFPVVPNSGPSQSGASEVGPTGATTPTSAPTTDVMIPANSPTTEPRNPPQESERVAPATNPTYQPTGRSAQP